MSAKLPKSWPPIARHILLEAARFFYREMNEQFPVYDANMESAIEYANRELAGRQREIYEEASPRWITRWEKGQLDAEMKKAIDATYGSLRRAERGLRSHAVKKSSALLEREIEDQDLADFVRGKFKYNATQRARLGYLVTGILRDRGVATEGADDSALAAIARAELARSAVPSHATVKRPTLGRGMITEEQARAMPRYDFIAHWLAVVTRKKENRGPLGLYVKHVGKRWQIVSPVGGGTVTYETPDPALLFDYARRGQLGSHIRDAEEFRGLAYQRVGVS